MSLIPIILLSVCLVLLIVILVKQTSNRSLDFVEKNIQQLEPRIESSYDRLQQSFQQQIMNLSSRSREEQTNNLLNFQKNISSQITTILSLQENQLTNFSDRLENLTGTNAAKIEQVRISLLQSTQNAQKEQIDRIHQLSVAILQTLSEISEVNNSKINEIRNLLETKIQQMQSENSAKLEEMRQTVDEKLHATLEKRLGESFRLVSERLETVHRSLGEMQQLAVGVGDLKKVLTNVKTRGTWGEVQLGFLLEQILTNTQYEKNVETVSGSGAFVEFAIKLPGKQADSKPIWLPIDAKFPKEQYERLQNASEIGDMETVIAAGKELESALKLQAKTIAQKYISPPETTDFGLLFLPTEGLYAEVMRRPGLADEIQRKYRINIAGPSSLCALLNSLQMGFRTLAIEKRTSEVWNILGAVKTEFSKFGDVLDKTKKALEKVTQNIDQAQTRTRVMSRKLKEIESIPEDKSASILEVSSH